MKKALVFLCAVTLVFGVAKVASAVPFSYAATDLPQYIDDHTYTYSIIVPGDPGTVGDLNVLVDIDHTWIGDLDISLIHGSTEVQLFDHYGSLGDDLPDVTFDDEASTHISTATWPLNPAGSTYRPTEALSAFDGMGLSGVWVLSVYDWMGADQGWLNTFEMSGSTGAPVPEPATMLLLGSGLVGLAAFSRKKFFKGS